MTSPTDVHGVARHVAIEFLQSILPFKDLTDSALNNLTRQCVIAFFPRGTLVLEQDVSEVEHLYIIQKGGVKASLRAEDQSIALLEVLLAQHFALPKLNYIVFAPESPKHYHHLPPSNVPTHIDHQ